MPDPPSEHRSPESRHAPGPDGERLAWENGLILDSVAEGIVGIDGQGRITFSNQAISRMSGRGATALRGLRLAEALGPGILPAGAGESSALLPGLCEHGHTRTLRRGLLRCSDGSRLPVEYSCAPMFEGAALVGAVVVYSDISHRLEEEERLRDSENAIRALYHVVARQTRSALDKIEALLRMGNRRFGLDIGILSRIEENRYEVMAVVGGGDAIVRGSVFDLGDTYCRDVLRTRRPIGIEHASATTGRGHPCYRAARLEAYLGAPVLVGGRIQGTLNFSSASPRGTPFTAVDREVIQLMAQWTGGVIELGEMEARARERQTLLAHAARLNTLGELAAGITHELNQPLSAMVTYAEAARGLVTGKTGRDTRLADILERIARQGERAAAILKRMRRFARAGEEVRRPVRLGPLVAEVREWLDAELVRQSVTLEFSLDPALPAVLADDIQIQQVLLNLIHNALEAMSGQTGHKRISLRAWQRDARLIEVTVADTGPGLTADTAGRVFHPFVTTKPTGLGLGLSISQSIVEHYGGRLWSGSRAGTGASFHFTLPIAPRGSEP